MYSLTFRRNRLENPYKKLKTTSQKFQKKKTNCHIHIDGKLNGAQVAGMFGSENKVLPIIAKGQTQIRTKI